MTRRCRGVAGSLDMLLDTMCNTFGGVCFIALMVALMSVALPAGKGSEEGQDEVSEQMVVDKETARLERMRDELKAAIAVQKSFVSTNSANGVLDMSMTQLSLSVASNTTELAKMKAEKLELEDKLAKLTTDISYSRREAMRLERLLKDMEERLGKPGNMKSRAVRTPVERQLSGYRSVDLWLQNCRMYCLDNETHVSCKVTNGRNGKEWEYSVKPHSGYEMGGGFFSSHEYRQWVDSVSGSKFVRIYSDSVSFPKLCELRDDLIKRKKLYNWYVVEESTLNFVEGYDGKVQ